MRKVWRFRTFLSACLLGLALGCTPQERVGLQEDAAGYLGLPKDAPREEVVKRAMEEAAKRSTNPFDLAAWGVTGGVVLLEGWLRRKQLATGAKNVLKVIKP